MNINSVHDYITAVEICFLTKVGQFRNPVMTDVLCRIL